MKNGSKFLQRPLLSVLLFAALALFSTDQAYAVGISPCDALIRTISPTVPLNSPEGQARLARNLNSKVLSLMNQFEPQRNKFYCGIASGVIVLNALYIKQPIRPLPIDRSQLGFQADHLPADFVPVFSRFTQTSFLEPLIDGSIKDIAAVHGQAKDGTPDLRNSGLQLRELAALMEAHGTSAETHFVDPQIPSSEYRRRLISALEKPDTFVIVNFDRTTLGQKGAGHISPLGTYDPQTDSVLLVDVNPTFAEWTWIDLEALIRAMGTRDLSENRGFIITGARRE